MCNFRVFPRLFSFALLCIPLTGFPESPPEKELTLETCRRLVLLNNYQIASRKLGMETAQLLFEGEKAAVWEPALVLAGDRVSNERENNTEEFIRQGVENFEEDNSLYRVSLEQPLVTGGQVALTYNVDHLDNNLREQRDLDFEEKEYDSFAGVTLTQPLLKNGGLQMGMQVVRLAKEESEMAFQEYRRQMMESLGQAEAAYWELWIAQERVALLEKSVEVSRKILVDNQARVEAGKMSDLEVREAEAGVAIRESQLLEARQSREEASERLVSFFALPEEESGVRIRVLDEAESTRPALPELKVQREQALQSHPDMLARESRVRQEALRADFAKNQRLPQLDLRASWGYNGLGDGFGDAWDATRDRDFASWSVGVELRVPLGGGKRKQGEYRAALNRLEQSRIDRMSVRRQVERALRTARTRVRNLYRQTENYRKVSELNQMILDTELTRLEAGRSDSRKVLEAEENLTRARESYADSLARLAVARVELELTGGTLLRTRKAEPMEFSDVAGVDSSSAGGRE